MRSNSLGLIRVVLVVELVLGQGLNRARISGSGRQWGQDLVRRGVLRVASRTSAIVLLHTRGRVDTSGSKSTFQRLCVEDDVPWAGTDVEAALQVALTTNKKQYRGIMLQLRPGCFKHQGDWAIQRSWFVRVNALCNLSRKKSREVAAHFRADF